MKFFIILVLIMFYQQKSAYDIEVKKFTIDPGHTFVTFEVKRFDMLDVVSTFRDVTGTITMYPDNLSETKTDIIIKTSSLESGNQQRDNAVKSPNFLHTAEFPVITFISKSLKPSGNNWIAEGKLTIRGVTKNVLLPVAITGPRKDPTGLIAVAIKGELTINRLDYGVSFDRKLPGGESFIGNDVKIEINALAVQE